MFRRIMPELFVRSVEAYSHLHERAAAYTASSAGEEHENLQMVVAGGRLGQDRCTENQAFLLRRIGQLF